jgi:DNA polymerase V
MYLAKIALDITAKHSEDRIGWLTQEKFIKTLWHHKPITDFWGISTGTRDRLAKFGIHDMAGIASTSEDLLYDEFGVNAELLIDHAFGRETCLMCDIKNYKSKSRSISNSQILPCNYSFRDAKLVFKEMIQEGCYRLARENFITSHISISVGYGNKNRGISKGSVTMSIFTNLYSQMILYAEKLFDEVVSKIEPIRKISFSFGALVEDKYQQQSLFFDSEKANKEKKLVQCILDLKDKYGRNAVLKAQDYQEMATQKDRNQQIGGHNSGENEDAEN